MASTLLVVQFVLGLATISLLPSLPLVSCKDSKAKATNNNSRVLHFPEPVAADLRVSVVTASTEPEVVKPRKAPVVRVPWMTLMWEV